MKRDTERRLQALENNSTDHISRLPFIDYLGMTDYSNGEWDELHHDSTITVVRHRGSGDIRGVYRDRRSDDELAEAGGNLAYL
jgi:hypothetical protein